MNTYEIFCHNHSQIIQAESLALAVVQFNVENPNEDAIFAENVEYRRLNESAPVDDVVERDKMIARILINVENTNGGLRDVADEIWDARQPEIDVLKKRVEELEAILRHPDSTVRNAFVNPKTF